MMDHGHITLMTMDVITFQSRKKVCSLAKAMKLTRQMLPILRPSFKQVIYDYTLHTSPYPICIIKSSQSCNSRKKTIKSKSNLTR